MQGDVLVERSAPPMVSGINNHLDMNSHTLGSSGISKNHGFHPSSSKDLPLAENHHHHHHKRHHGKGRVRKNYKNNSDRFSRTAAVLRHAGLLKLTLQIAQLMKTNEDLQKEIDELQREAMEYSENLKSQIQQKLSEQNISS